MVALLLSSQLSSCFSEYSPNKRQNPWSVTLSKLRHQAPLKWLAVHTHSDLPCTHCAETRVALIQRSCGYALRPTLDIAEIDMAVQVLKSQQPGCVVAVDNCYGEFTANKEPCAVSPSFLTSMPPVALTGSAQHVTGCMSQFSTQPQQCQHCSFTAVET